MVREISQIVITTQDMRRMVKGQLYTAHHFQGMHADPNQGAALRNGNWTIEKRFFRYGNSPMRALQQRARPRRVRAHRSHACASASA